MRGVKFCIGSNREHTNIILKYFYTLKFTDVATAWNLEVMYMTLLTSHLVHFITEKVGNTVLRNAEYDSLRDAASYPATLEFTFNAVGRRWGGLQTEILHGTG